MQKFFTFSFFAFLAFVSCTKNPQLSSLNTSDKAIGLSAHRISQTLSYSGQWDSAANTGNAGDSSGLIHDLAVDYVQSAVGMSFTLFPTLRHKIYDSTLSYLRKYWGSSFDTAAMRLNFPYSTVEGSADTAIAGTSQHIIDTVSRYSTSVRNSLVNLIAIMQDTTDIPASVPYDSIKSRIVHWEDTVAASGTYSSGDKNLMLGSSSVARFSLFYWHVKFDIQWGSMTPAQQAATTKKRKWWTWVIVGAADVVGFIAGNSKKPYDSGAGISVGGGASNVAYNLTAPH